MEKQIKIQSIIDKSIDSKNIFGIRLSVKNDEFDFSGYSGDFKINEPYFIASVTKLFITAIIMHLREEKTLTLEDPISRYFGSDVLRGLHIYYGTDFSEYITLRHLLSHTSGLPDYFQDKNNSGESLEKMLLRNSDRAFSFEEILELSKGIKPHFPPGKKGKAHYSDTNFQLLGKIIEKIRSASLKDVINEIVIDQVGMSRTYLYSNPQDTVPKSLRYKNMVLNIPLAMCSFWADGGIVSTSEDMMVFIRSFFGGKFFHPDYLKEMTVWNRIFFPLQAGVGILRFKIPGIFSPFQPLPQLIGHSGLSGAFAFYAPEKNLYLSGTVNQINNPALSFRLLMKIANLF